MERALVAKRRFMTSAQKAYDFILSSLNSGLTVYISTAMKHTKVTPNTFNKWAKSGNTLFRMTDNGHLEIARGKNFDSIAINNIMLVKITAIKE
jgi:hypothetical protein